MLFNSVAFLCFALIVIPVYWVLPSKWRWVHLLASSYFFYACWEPLYIFLILFSTLVDYLISLKLTSSNNSKVKRIGLISSVILNLGLLFTFKYYTFFQEILSSLLSYLNIEYNPTELNVLLPIGISFYTFQTISYTVDVYRGHIAPIKHLGKFALFVAYFPQLIAGPIERAKNLVSQFNRRITFNFQQFWDGVLLFFWGLFKKVVVADNVRLIVNHYFDNSEFQNGGSMFFAIFLFSVQIYADFSGYSDMAVGISKMLGIDLKNNFISPYFSQNFKEFWKRWHITLSEWFRDYVYIPLGGNRKRYLRQLFNIALTLLLSGLWHGAAYKYILWGGIQAAFIILERMTHLDRKATNPIIVLTKTAFTFALTMFSMSLFRIADFNQGLDIGILLMDFKLEDFILIVRENYLTSGVLAAGFLFMMDLYFGKRGVLKINQLKPYLQSAWLILLIILIILEGNSSSQAFFYFQF